MPFFFTIPISRTMPINAMIEKSSPQISDTEVTMLFRQIAELKANRVAVIYITHKMDEIFQIADDITVTVGCRRSMEPSFGR